MRKLITMMAALLMLSLNVSAADETESRIRAALSALNAQVPILSVRASAFPDLYEVKLASGELLYTNANGSHFVVGEVYRVETNGGLVNLTEENKKIGRVEQLKTVAREDMVIFPAKGEKKAHVTVYTDVDCFYCRKLHKEMKAITEQGIEVRYLAFPRAGAGSKAHQTMESIWCAAEDQRGKLMTQAKSGASIPATVCENSPVIAQWQLGQQMGVNGTPALVLEDGTMVPGYVPAPQLAKMLNVVN